MSKRNRKKLQQTQIKNRKPIQQALLDIVIPVHGRFDLLKQCLDSIPDSMSPSTSYQVILFDNGSDDKERRAFYDQYKNRYTILFSNTNQGFPAACNHAAGYGNSPLIFFLNSDVVLSPGSVDLLIKSMDVPETGAVGMKLIFPKDIDDYSRPAGKIQHVGISVNIRGEVFHQFMGWNPDHPKVNAMDDVFAVTGAALMTRRSLWKKIGGFYTGYGMGTYEDCEFCVEIRKLGYNVRVNTQSFATHYAGATAVKYGIQYPLGLNRTIFLSRHQQDLYYDEWKHW